MREIQMKKINQIKFKKIQQLKNKAIRLKKELLKTIDKIYLIDELEGENVNDFINDEKMMRG